MHIVALGIVDSGWTIFWIAAVWLALIIWAVRVAGSLGASILRPTLSLLRRGLGRYR